MKYEFATELTERQRATFAERLLRLREVLLTLPPEAYNHGVFVADFDCGTVCSALGWAASKKHAFRGLALHVVDHDLRPLDDGAGITNTADAYFGEEAYENIFSGIAYGTWSGNVTVSMVADRIEKVARERYGYEPVTP